MITPVTDYLCDHGDMTRRRDVSSTRTDKHARALVRAVLAAKGTVEMTTKGHLKITGPQGVAFVGVHRCDRRTILNSIGHIRRHSGLDIRLQT